MKYDSIDILKKSDFFNNKLEQITKIEEISDNKLKITSKESVFVLGLYEIDRYKDFEKEKKINDHLKNIDLEPLEIYYIGIMPDINKSYKIFEYRNEISLKDYLKEENNEDKYKLGLKFGQILKNIHYIPLKNTIADYWYNYVNTKVNYLLYRHGLQTQINDRDYILIDYLNENKYMVKNTSNNLLYSNLNDKNIRIYEDDKIDIRGLRDFNYGDGISDFVEINKIAIENPEFARGVLESYHDKKIVPRKFYRLLSFYEAYVILDSLVNIREGKKSYLNIEQIEKIMNMYDNFSNVKPQWAK